MSSTAAEAGPRSRAGGSLRSRPALGLVGGGLAALGVGALLVASALRAAPPSVAGPTAPVNPSATDPADIGANNSPGLVVNPRDPANLAVVNRIDSPRFSCALHVSRNGGQSWSPVPVPFPEGEELPERCFAPDAAFDAAGTFYMTFVTLRGTGNVPNAGWVVTSTDGGLNLSLPRRILGPLSFQVRLVADDSRPGRLYLTWLQAQATGLLRFPEPGNPIQFSRSEDGGRTWSPPIQVNPGSRLRVVAPSIATGADDELLVLYLDLGEDALDYHGGHEGVGGEPYAGTWSLVLARSGDGGATWSETVVDGGVVPTERFLVFLPPAPSLAVDPGKGRAYVTFQDGRRGDADVWVWTSSDRGRSFGGPVRVNDTRIGDGTAQHLPRAAVADGGRLDVVYYDRRADRDDIMTEVSFQSSSDGGRSFGPRLRLSDRPFDSRIGFDTEQGMRNLGTRLGLVSSPRRATAVWTDTRAGTDVSKKQDLARAVVVFPAPPGARGPLRAAGLAAVVAGVGVLAAWTIKGRAERRRDGPGGDGPGRGSPPDAP